MFVEAIPLAYFSLDAIPVNGPFEGPFGHGKEYLVGRGGQRQVQDFEPRQIKIGTPVKEFLNEFLAFEPLGSVEGKRTHGSPDCTTIRVSLVGG